MHTIKTPSLGKIFVLFVMALSMGACSTSKSWESVQRYSSPAQDDKTYNASWHKRPSGQVAPGYLISIKSSDPKVNGEFRIEFDNSIRLPYNVRVNTAGLSEEQLRDAIRSSYRSYFKSPEDLKIAVAKKEYLVEAQGLVNKPGQYFLKQDSSLDEIISQAGGLQEGNRQENVARYARISGPSGNGMIRLADYHSGSKVVTPQWQGGEVVFFQSEGKAGIASNHPERNTVNVLGQVRNPGEYAVENQSDFFTYLLKAGGPTDRGDLGNITVIRSEGNETKALTFNMLDTDSIPQILPGDAIILNADNATPLEKKSRVGANFANIVSALGLVAIAALH